MDNTADYLRSRMRTGRPQREVLDASGRQQVRTQPIQPVAHQASSDSVGWVAFPNGMASSKPVAFAGPPSVNIAQQQVSQNPQNIPQSMPPVTSVSHTKVAPVAPAQATIRQVSMESQPQTLRPTPPKQQLPQNNVQPVRHVVQSNMLNTPQPQAISSQPASVSVTSVAHSPTSSAQSGIRPVPSGNVYADKPVSNQPKADSENDFWVENQPNPEHEQTLTDVLGYGTPDDRLDQLIDAPSKKKIGLVAKVMTFMATAATMFAIGIGISFLQGRPQEPNAQQPSTEQVLGAQTTAQSAPQGQDSNTISLGEANSGGLTGSLQPFMNQADATPENGYIRSEGTYKNAKLTISKQPLPDSLRGGDQAFINVAQQLGATTKLATKKWGTVYLATVQAQQVQVLIMKSTSQMVVVQSDRILPATDWPAYVDSL